MKILPFEMPMRKPMKKTTVNDRIVYSNKSMTKHIAVRQQQQHKKWNENKEKPRSMWKKLFYLKKKKTYLRKDYRRGDFRPKMINK